MQTKQILSLAALVVAGCGNVAGQHYNPPYGTLHGTITNISTPVHQSQVHVALAWLAVQPGQGAFQVAQDVAVRAQFPTTFTLDITALPPPETVSGFQTDAARKKAMMQGLDPTMQWAQGVVIVYEDRNGNGKLDLVSPGQTSPDRVLGKAEGIQVFFLQSGRAAPATAIGGLPTAPGLSVVHVDLVDPAPGDCGYDSPAGYVARQCGNGYANQAQLAFPTDIQIALSAAPQLQGYACAQFWSSDEWPDWASGWSLDSPLEAQICSGAACACLGTGCPLDLPLAGAQVTCNSDRTAYVYKTCVDDPDLCGTRFCHFGHGERQAGVAIPAGWPCPSQ